MPEAPAESFHVVEFRLEDMRFGLPLNQVQEVVPAVAIVPLPSAPEIVLGVFVLRGEPVALLDTRRRFGFPPKPLGIHEHFLICHDHQRRIALRVDHAEGLLTINSNDVQPADRIADTANQFSGIVILADGMLLIQDLPQFLSSQEVIQLEAALRQWSSSENS